MAALSFPDARALVLREVRAGMLLPTSETVELSALPGRILAEDIRADRDYPPFHRSMRDGFAVRAADIPGRLRVIGEVRAGQAFHRSIGPGEAVEIMTGAPVPEGADAVVMIEHTVRDDERTVSADRHIHPGDNVASRASEAKAGAVMLPRGVRIDYTSIACLAAAGHASPRVYARPRVAILSTGDEIVEVGETPSPVQIRNSNAWALAAQVERAHGIPVVLPIARDTEEHTRTLIEQGLDCDLLLLSGGVSAGKYDVVEPVLAKLGAQFYFDRVLIQPGQPLVFGRIRNRFFFGLPGNPASTMVTFELFARAAIGILSGATDVSLPLALARLTQPFRHKPGLTRFLPAFLNGAFPSGAEVTPVASQGSGDIAALSRANCYLVADPDRPEYAAGDLIPILFK